MKNIFSILFIYTPLIIVFAQPLIEDTTKSKETVEILLRKDSRDFIRLQSIDRLRIIAGKNN